MTNYREKITALWSVFLLGTLFHTQLGLMPLFHGLSVAHSESKAMSDITWVLWSMMVFFVIPMFAIIATTFTESRRYKVLHFGVTVIYSILNLLHLILDLFVQPIVWSQIVLMGILFTIGLLLNLVAFQWLKNSSKSDRLQHQLGAMNQIEKI